MSTTTSSTMSRNGRPRARLAAQMARNSNIPVRLRTATMSIIPMSRKMTLQSMPVSFEKKARSPLVAPM